MNMFSWDSQPKNNGDPIAPKVKKIIWGLDWAGYINRLLQILATRALSAQYRIISYLLIDAWEKLILKI